MASLYGVEEIDLLQESEGFDLVAAAGRDHGLVIGSPDPQADRSRARPEGGQASSQITLKIEDLPAPEGNDLERMVALDGGADVEGLTEIALEHERFTVVGVAQGRRIDVEGDAL
jgi:hypothetical protein